MALRHLALTISLLLSLSIVATAQATVDTIMRLGEVKVVASKKANINVIPAQSLTGKQLESLNSHSVADAIRYFSGVQIKDYGGVGGVKTVDVRSMGSNHMGVFYDGIQLGNAQNGQIDLGKFSLDNMEEISLYNGQKSDIFQSAKDFGAAGTIYLRTRTPRFNNGKNNNFRFIFRTGSFGLVNPSALWEWKISKNVSSTINAEYTYATGKYKFRYKKAFSDGTMAWDTTATRQNGDLHAFRGEIGIFGRIESGQWNLKAYYYDSEKGIPGAIVNNVWKSSQRQWDRNFFTQGSFRKQFSRLYDLKINAKYARDFMHYNNPDTTLMYIDNRFWQNELYVSAVNKFTILPKWDVNLSVDYQWNNLDATLADFVHPTRNTVLTALATSYQWRGWKGQASVLGSFINDHTDKSSSSSHKYFTPAFFINYQPWSGRGISFRAFYKRIFRMPTFNDLYYTDMGNASLKPEYATQYNAGVVYNLSLNTGILDYINLSADGYYNEVTDKIISVPKGTGQYRWMMMNIGKVKINGCDITSRFNFTLPYSIILDASLNYTYQQALDYSDPSDNGDGGTYKGMIAYIPRHSGSFALHGAYRKLELNYSFIYVGERYHTSSNIPENYEQPWYTHDCSVSYGLNINRVKFNISLEINNLLNQQYDVIRNYPMPGRNFKAILKIDI